MIQFIDMGRVVMLAMLAVPTALALQLLPAPPSLFSTLQSSATLQSPDPLNDYLSAQLLRSRTIKCPFFRRRAGDLVESGQWIMDFLASRHKSLALDSLAVLPPRSMGSKMLRATVADVMPVVRKDIEESQYYVSGRLTQAVYSDSCCFDGPDPDLPVRSLARYTDALRGLFNTRLSRIELLQMEQCGPREFTVHWRLEGALRLPGAPRIKPYLGCTLYELDDDGLICSHTEAWSISALDAFVSTVFPSFGAEPAPPVAEFPPDMVLPAAPAPQRRPNGEAI